MLKIPYISIPDKPIISTSQDLMPVIDIIDGIVIFRNGSACLVMESTSLNFGLLNEKEQVSVIASYAGLLNSFNFPVQIVVRSQRKDISSYMQYLSEEARNIKNPKLANLMKDYQRFILEAVKKKNILSKKFYIAIPFTAYELGIAKSFASTFGRGPLPFPKSYVVRKAKITLYPKRDHLIRQAGRLGVVFTPLNNEKLINLIYDIYNPDVHGIQENKLQQPEVV